MLGTVFTSTVSGGWPELGRSVPSRIDQRDACGWAELNACVGYFLLSLATRIALQLLERIPYRQWMRQNLVSLRRNRVKNIFLSCRIKLFGWRGIFGFKNKIKSYFMITEVVQTVWRQ